MSNFLSQVAAARAGGQATGAMAGLQIRRTGLGEMQTIEDEIRTMEEKFAAEKESARKRDSRRGRGRLAGLILGGGLAALTGGTSLVIGLGAGLGSLAGQEIGSRYSISPGSISKRKRTLGRIKAGLAANEGLFHQGKRKDVELQRSKVNQFLRDADRQFNDRILESSLSDAFSAFQLSGGKLTDIFGKEGAKNVGASAISADSMKKSVFGKNPILPKGAAKSKFTLGGYGATPGKLGKWSDAAKLFKGTPLAPFIDQSIKTTAIPNYLKALPDYSFVNKFVKPESVNSYDDILSAIGGIR